MEVLVIDGQGGRIGQQLIRGIRGRYPHLAVTAVGTNSMATAAMLKGGAEQAATGENAVVAACRRGAVPGKKDPPPPEPLRQHRGRSGRPRSGGPAGGRVDGAGSNAGTEHLSLCVKFVIIMPKVSERPQRGGTAQVHEISAVEPFHL